MTVDVYGVVPEWAEMGATSAADFDKKRLAFFFCLMFDSDQPEDALRPYFVLEYVSTRKMDLTGCRTIEDLKEEEIASCYPAASTR